MADTAILDTRPQGTRLGLMAWMTIARDRHGKGFLGQVVEMIRLSRPPCRLQPGEYFAFRLYDDRRYTPEAKATFIGTRFRAWLRTDVLRGWFWIGDDKPAVKDLLRANDLPIPETRAVFHAFRASGADRVLRTPDEVAQWLGSETTYPLFAKLADARIGAGAASIDRCDGDTLVLRDGREVPIPAFVDALSPFAEAGVLFEERLAPHAEIAAALGEGQLATVRVLVLVPPGGQPTVHRAGCRIPTGTHPTDNIWRKGNLYASVDPETGQVMEAVQGEDGTYDRIHTHPSTGVAFAGLQLPDWDRVRELALRAAAILPLCPIQAWDIALTPDGPVFLELEADGAEPGMFQLGHDTGLYSGAYRDLIEQLQRKRQAELDWSARHRKDLTVDAYQEVYANRE